MKKVWKNINLKYDNLEIIELDYDMDKDEVSKYNVGDILPVVIFVSNERTELERLIGEQKESVLIDKIDRLSDY